MSPAVALKGVKSGPDLLGWSVPAKVIALENRELTSIGKWTGRGLEECERLARLLQFRRQGLDADLQNRWARSDFFWRECNRQLRVLAGDAKVWTAAAALAGVEADGAGALRDAVVDQLFIRTHLALQAAAAKFSGEKPGPNEREFAYTGHLRDLCSAAGVSAEGQAKLLVPLIDRWIEAQSEAKKWPNAIEITRDTIRRVPQERKYPEKLIWLEFLSTKDSLTQGPLKPKDGRKLKTGIQQMEQLRVQYSWIPVAFTLIGTLRHLRAIALGNNNELSEALVESQKAIDYEPGDEAAVKTQDGLAQNMNSLRARMEIVLREVRTGYNKRLSAEGVKLKNEAQRGFTPVNEYVKSAERSLIQQDIAAARQKAIWIDAGYAEPAADWNERASRLFMVFTEIVEKSPTGRTELEVFVKEHMAGDPLLAGLAPGPAVEFLAGRIFPGEQPRPEAVPSAANPEPFPEYRFESNKPARGEEPFFFWLFSRQGMRLKVQFAIGLFLLVGGLVLAGFDASRRSLHDLTYRAMLAASNDGDYSRVLDAGENFLSHPGLRADDRAPQVKALYSEALVRWFSSLPGTPDQAALQRVRRYQQITGQAQ